jgi:subtilisin family serine protease
MHSIFRLLLLVLLAAALVGPAHAADLQRDVRAGDEVEGQLAPGDLHTFRIDLPVGADFRAKVEAEGVEVGKDEGPPPELSLLTPGGATLATESDFDAVVRHLTTEAGTYAVTLRAGAFAGSYELSFKVEFEDSVESEVPVGPEPVTVHVDVPEGAMVRIEVRRRSGAPPEVRGVFDATGRELVTRTKKQSADRVRLFPLPVTAPGGLDVIVGSRGDAGGTYDVRAEVTDDGDDDAPGDDDDDHAEREIVLQLAPGTDPEALAAALGYEVEKVYDGFVVLRTPEGREGFEDDDAKDAADRFGEVLGGEPNLLADLPEGSQANPVILGSDVGRSEFDSQAQVVALRGANAHRRATGAGVVVAVLDTGIDAQHPVLAGRVLPGFDFVDGDADPSEATNGLDDDGDGNADEAFGHGTFVAGLVLAAAPDAHILPVRVLDTDGHGSIAAIAAGIDYAVRQGASVINLSFGSRARSSVLGGAVRYAIHNGVAVTAAAGNRGSTAKVDFPGGIAGVIAVTSLDATGALPPFANAGGRTSIAAPGVDLIGPYPGDRYATWSGTSFSAALASGGAALLRERKPRFDAERVARVMRKRAKPAKGVPRKARRLVGGGRLDLARLAR